MASTYSAIKIELIGTGINPVLGATPPTQTLAPPLKKPSLVGLRLTLLLMRI
jgi:hypothetical protein